MTKIKQFFTPIKIIQLIIFVFIIIWTPRTEYLMSKNLVSLQQGLRMTSVSQVMLPVAFFLNGIEYLIKKDKSSKAKISMHFWFGFSLFMLILAIQSLFLLFMG
jgi:hypothetical protein